MTDSPPTNPDTGSADQAALSVKEQLDRLLAQIESEEPGTIDPAALPEGFNKGRQADGVQASQSASDEELADAAASFEAALDTSQELDEPPAEAPAPALAEPAPAAATEPEADEADSEETDMLAALNAALQDLNPGSDAANEAEPEVETKTQDQAPPTQPADTPESEQDTEKRLQDEINAVLTATPDAEPSDADQPGDGGADQDQIVADIQHLLESESEPGADDPDQPTEADADDPSIDELDRMLANEIAEDEELAGDFQSVEDLTAGIKTPERDAVEAADEHAASARDVAAELDNQPEEAPLGNDEARDPPAALAQIADTAQQNHVAHEASWPRRLARAGERALRVCHAINWPARRFLNYEWRETLGYVSLTVAFSAVAVWLYLILT